MASPGASSQARSESGTSLQHSPLPSSENVLSPDKYFSQVPARVLPGKPPPRNLSPRAQLHYGRLTTIHARSQFHEGDDEGVGWRRGNGSHHHVDPETLQQQNEAAIDSFLNEEREARFKLETQWYDRLEYFATFYDLGHMLHERERASERFAQIEELLEQPPIDVEAVSLPSRIKSVVPVVDHVLNLLAKTLRDQETLQHARDGDETQVAQLRERLVVLQSEHETALSDAQTRNNELSDEVAQLRDEVTYWEGEAERAAAEADDSAGLTKAMISKLVAQWATARANRITETAHDRAEINAQATFDADFGDQITTSFSDINDSILSADGNSPAQQSKSSQGSGGGVQLPPALANQAEDPSWAHEASEMDPQAQVLFLGCLVESYEIAMRERDARDTIMEKYADFNQQCLADLEDGVDLLDATLVQERGRLRELEDDNASLHATVADLRAETESALQHASDVQSTSGQQFDRVKTLEADNARLALDAKNAAETIEALRAELKAKHAESDSSASQCVSRAVQTIGGSGSGGSNAARLSYFQPHGAIAGHELFIASFPYIKDTGSGGLDDTLRSSRRVAGVVTFNLFAGTLVTRIVSSGKQESFSGSEMVVAERNRDDPCGVRIVFQSNELRMLFNSPNERERALELAWAMHPTLRLCAPDVTVPGGGDLYDTIVDGCKPTPFLKTKEVVFEADGGVRRVPLDTASYPTFASRGVMPDEGDLEATRCHLRATATASDQIKLWIGCGTGAISSLKEYCAKSRSSSSGSSDPDPLTVFTIAIDNVPDIRTATFEVSRALGESHFEVCSMNERDSLFAIYASKDLVGSVMNVDFASRQDVVTEAEVFAARITIGATSLFFAHFANSPSHQLTAADKAEVAPRLLQQVALTLVDADAMISCDSVFFTGALLAAFGGSTRCLARSSAGYAIASAVDAPGTHRPLEPTVGTDGTVSATVVLVTTKPRPALLSSRVFDAVVRLRLARLSVTFADALSHRDSQAVVELSGEAVIDSHSVTVASSSATTSSHFESTQSVSIAFLSPVPEAVASSLIVAQIHGASAAVHIPIAAARGSRGACWEAPLYERCVRVGTVSFET